MRITNKGHYTIRVVLDIALHSYPHGAVRLQEISNRQKISLHFLEQIARKLRVAKIIKSIRGGSGGYILADDMNKITIKQILQAVGENTNIGKNILPIPSSGFDIDYDEREESLTIVDSPEYEVTKNYFKSFGKIMEDMLNNMTIEKLLETKGNL